MNKFLLHGLAVLAALLISVPVLGNPTIPSVEPQSPTTVSFIATTPPQVLSTYEEDVLYLTLALYFEGRPNEPEEGLQAIASVIMNRVNSRYFPNTIKEVVTQGAKGQSTGKCQFSFMCDPHPEDKELLCQLPKRAIDMQTYWGENGCEKRWDAYLAFAKQFLTHKEDNTGKAVMYYAASMRKRPYWHVDLIESSRKELGSHLFFRSKRFEEKDNKASASVVSTGTQ